MVGVSIGKTGHVVLISLLRGTVDDILGQYCFSSNDPNSSNDVLRS